MAALTMTRGTSATVTVTILDGDGAALDLTGTTLHFTAKRSLRDAQADAVIAKVTGAGITHRTPQSGGIADVAIAPADTSGLAPYPIALAYDVELVSGVDVYATESGTLTVSPDSTTL
jgi:hypothetical protein